MEGITRFVTSARPPKSQSDQFMLYRIESGLRTIGDIEFEQNRADIALDRALGQAQSGGDLLVALSMR